MISRKIKDSRGHIVDVEYEGFIYILEDYCEQEIEDGHVIERNLIILKRKDSNEIVKIFKSENIESIIQININGKAHFVVYEFEDEKWYLVNYVDIGYGSLRKMNSIPCSMERITDSSFIIEKDDGYLYLYNLEKVSNKFDKIYADDEIRKLLGDDKVVMVKETKTAKYNHDIYDTIIYGINPETYKIVTPIYSSLQNRFIDVYTDEEIEKLNEIRKSLGQYTLNVRGVSNEAITIFVEIEEYLEKLDMYLPKEDDIYLDSMQSKLNEEYILKFKREEKDNKSS